MNAPLKPSGIEMLLHNALCEFDCIYGIADLDDTQDVIDARLLANRDYAEKPGSPFIDYQDCLDYLQRRTGLPYLLCFYYLFYLSESSASMYFREYTDEAVQRARQTHMNNDFSLAVVDTIISSLIHPSGEWREFSHGLIGELIAQEDKRREERAEILALSIEKMSCDD